MNSGIQDAHNLAWKLARVLHGGDADKLLDSYDVERRQAIRRYVNRTTDYLTRAIVQGSDLQRSFFARAARTGLNLSPLRRRVLPRMAMLDIRYRDSPLFPIADRRVGLRAPNCLVEGLDGIVRLHDLVREGPCLLRLNATEVKEVAGIKQEILGPSMAPELFEELHVDRKTAILLRPDGFIGLFIENPAQDELAASVAAALGDA